MKFRRRSLPYLVLFLASIQAAAASLDASIQDSAPAAQIVERQPKQPATNLDPAPRIGKPNPATEDAPVDGLDGKPHKGPFVDQAAPVNAVPAAAAVGPAKGKIRVFVDEGVRKPAPAAAVAPVAAAKAFAAKAAAAQVPEDGVMNDPNRPPPKKGTTGTEGGVSEKERDRRLVESITQQKQVNEPPTPKGAQIQVEQPRQVGSSEQKVPPPPPPGKSAVDSNAPNGLDDVKPKGAAGFQKPADQPAVTAGKAVVAAHQRLGQAREQAVPVGTAEGTEPSTKGSSNPDTWEAAREKVRSSSDIIPWDALAGSFSSIAATEIGDKTFIVAALMAMRHDRSQVFTAAFSALFIMTILSGLCGHVVGALISKRWAAVLAAILFLVFGAKSLREGLAMSPDAGVSEEIKEVEAELEEKEAEMARDGNRGHRRVSSISPYALEAGRTARKSRSRSRVGAPARSSSSSSRTPSPSRGASVASALAGLRNLLSLLLSPAWVETFSMTFIGELGDRSQIATVAMAAGQEYFWVMVGASLGHFVCTAIAVIGGSVLAGRVSMRKVTLVGGAIFLAFGVFTFIEAWMMFM